MPVRLAPQQHRRWSAAAGSGLLCKHTPHAKSSDHQLLPPVRRNVLSTGDCSRQRWRHALNGALLLHRL